MINDDDSHPSVEPDATASTQAGNLVEISVTELSNLLKRTVEDRFGLVRVRGEITGFRGAHSSGHCYFALKDERARLEAVIWRGQLAKMKQRPEEGMEVVATGKLTTFPGSSKYQIVIENLEAAGAGALMALLEERKRKLAAEGLFAPERKQLLPFMPKVIGVVTSPTGAVIRDVLHRLTDRFPLHVIVWPVRVQGDSSGAEVAAGIAGLNALDGSLGLPRPDVIIVARGGGSIEDLWGFNDEGVVRAAAASAIPLISAVGHETDWTLIDLAADLRAPTPTGAAEMAVPVKAELEATNAALAARLQAAIRRRLEDARTKLTAAQRGLGSAEDALASPRQRYDQAAARLKTGLRLAVQAKGSELSLIRGRLSPAILARLTGQARQRLELTATRSAAAFSRSLSTHGRKLDKAASRLRIGTLDRRIADARARLDQSWRLVNSLSHRKVLERGFALITDSKGVPVTQAAAVQGGQALSVEMQDGRFGVVVGGSGSSAGGVNPAKRTRPTTQGQTSLFGNND